MWTLTKFQKLIIVLVIVVLATCSISYSYWQFDLCYPEVSDSVWYCVQHAFGN